MTFTADKNPYAAIVMTVRWTLAIFSIGRMLLDSIHCRQESYAAIVMAVRWTQAILALDDIHCRQESLCCNCHDSEMDTGHFLHWKDVIG